jgi:gas vesicle protein
MKKAGRVLKSRRQTRGLLRAIGAFIIGATAGGVIALLFAPTSGQVTRRRIGLKFRTLQRQAGRQLKVTASQLRQAAALQVNHAREWVVGRVANGHSRPTTRRAVRHA